VNTARPHTLLRVVRGEPTEEELAAVVAVITARSIAVTASAAPSTRRSSWAAPRPRRALRAGPGAWTASARPE
jgi:hypothetical protein